MNRFLVPCLVLSIAACGNDSVSLDDFEGAYLDAYCEGAVKCGGQPSLAACKASLNLDTNSFLTLFGAAKSGTIKYDEEQAAACLDSVREPSCTFEGLHGDDPCSEALTGTVAMGGECFISAECVGGATCTATDENCDDNTMCCPGTCGTPSVDVAAGAPCGENDICPNNQYCKLPETGDVGTCTALLTSVGAACDDFFACADPMICNLLSETPTCEKSVGTGETCDPEALIPCVEDRDHCDESNTCVGPLAEGAVCESSSDCAADSTCLDTCQQNIAAGGACSANGPDCLGDLECVNGTCQLDPAGMSCR
jgi:hypothetical protein